LVSSAEEPPAGYVADRNFVVAYDLDSGKTRVLLRKDNTEWLPGDGKFAVLSIAGERALILEYGQQRKDYTSKGKHYWLNIRTGALTPLPIYEEMAQRGRDVGVYYLLDDKGTLVFVTSPPDDPTASNPNAPKELWLRHPSGEYVRLGETVTFYSRMGGEDGRVYYWTASGRRMMAYDINEKSFHEISQKDLPDEREYPTVGLRVETSGIPVISRRVKHTYPYEWRQEALNINTDKLR
jgi:hypothetical protein